MVRAAAVIVAMARLPRVPLRVRSDAAPSTNQTLRSPRQRVDVERSQGTGQDAPRARRAARGGRMVLIEPGRASMDTSYVAVAVVTSRTEAELIAGLLRSNGLEAAVSADDAGGQDPQLQILGVRVLVASADEAAARQV